jgi:hypothetical protein
LAARRSGIEGAGKLTITTKQAKAAPAIPKMEIPGSDLSAMFSPGTKEVVNRGGQQLNAQLPAAERRRVKSENKRITGEPGRTRTYNPLIKSQLLYH